MRDAQSNSDQQMPVSTKRLTNTWFLLLRVTANKDLLDKLGNTALSWHFPIGMLRHECGSNCFGCHVRLGLCSREDLM